MNEEPAPLWSDEQISEEVETLALGYKARHVLRRMRDDYEAMLSMACQMSPSEEATIARLTQANAELTAEVERLKAENRRMSNKPVLGPNWNHAPDWARYWTCDENGRTMWWEDEPYSSKAYGIWMCEEEGKRTYATNRPTMIERPAPP